MPRVLRKTKIRLGAERKCGTCGRVIEPGEEYLQWSFRYGGARYRCIDHPPRPSDLTQSKMSTIYAAVEDADGAIAGAETVSEVKDAVDTVADSVEEVMEEYREAAEPFGGQGENAERADELEGWLDELREFDPDEEDEGEDEDEDGGDGFEEARTEAMELVGGCPL